MRVYFSRATRLLLSYLFFFCISLLLLLLLLSFFGAAFGHGGHHHQQLATIFVAHTHTHTTISLASHIASPFVVRPDDTRGFNVFLMLFP